MQSEFFKLLKGEAVEEEIQISLKSVIPVFMAYPELVIPFKSSITEVAPYYSRDEDYLNPGDILLPPELSPNKLITLFTKVFQMIVNLAHTKESKLEVIPKVSLVIDIASRQSDYSIVVPSENEVKSFNSMESGMFTFSGFTASRSSETLTEAEKHNMLLIDILTRKYNNSGIGGR